MGLVAVSTVATGDTITASLQNTMRDNALVLDTRTGGDPAVTGRTLQSNGALSGVWVAAPTAGVAALGYTPVNKAGDVMTGSLQVLIDLIVAASGAVPGRVYVYDVGGAAYWLIQGGAGLSIVRSGTGAGLVLNAGGQLEWPGIIQGSRLKSTVATGTAPLDVASTTPVPNLTAATATNATQLGGVAAAGYPTLAGGGDFSTAPTINGDAVAKVASGNYTGSDAAARQITTGFVPRYVRIVGKNAGGTVLMCFDLVAPVASVAQNLRTAETAGATHIQVCADTYLHATDGFVVNGTGIDGSDSSALTYYWIAVGS